MRVREAACRWAASSSNATVAWEASANVTGHGRGSLRFSGWGDSLFCSWMAKVRPGMARSELWLQRFEESGEHGRFPGAAGPVPPHAQTEDAPASSQQTHRSCVVAEDPCMTPPGPSRTTRANRAWINRRTTTPRDKGSRPEARRKRKVFQINIKIRLKTRSGNVFEVRCNSTTHPAAPSAAVFQWIPWGDFGDENLGGRG